MIILSTVFALSGGSAALRIVSAEGRAPPDALVSETAAELRRARAARADTLAPATLGLAWDGYTEGLRLARRQQLRPEWLRDHDDAEGELARALEHARRATGIATRHRSREESVVAVSIETARRALAPLEGVEDVVWMPVAERRRLQTARRLLDTALALAERGEPVAAAGRAREATELARAVRLSTLRATTRFTDPERLRLWASWVESTVRWSRDERRVAIVVAKDEHRVIVYQNGRARASYAAELGWNNVGDKRRTGDGATPEGRYFVTQKKGPGASRYHRALLLDYPNRDDLRLLDELTRSGALAKGTRPGGLIELHGSGGRGRDWTDGCVALTDDEIDGLFGLVEVGTPVTIVGSLAGSGAFARVAGRLEDR